MLNTNLMFVRLEVCNKQCLILKFPFRISDMEQEVYVRPHEVSEIYKAPTPDIFGLAVSFTEFKKLINKHKSLGVEDITVRDTEIQLTLILEYDDNSERLLATVIKSAFGLGVAVPIRGTITGETGRHIVAWKQVVDRAN